MRNDVVNISWYLQQKEGSLSLLGGVFSNTRRFDCDADILFHGFEKSGWKVLRAGLVRQEARGSDDFRIRWRFTSKLGLFSENGWLDGGIDLHCNALAWCWYGCRTDKPRGEVWKFYRESQIGSQAAGFESAAFNWPVSLSSEISDWALTLRWGIGASSHLRYRTKLSLSSERLGFHSHLQSQPESDGFHL